MQQPAGQLWNGAVGHRWRWPCLTEKIQWTSCKSRTAHNSRKSAMCRIWDFFFSIPWKLRSFWRVKAIEV